MPQGCIESLGLRQADFVDDTRLSDFYLVVSLNTSSHPKIVVTLSTFSHPKIGAPIGLHVSEGYSCSWWVWVLSEGCTMLGRVLRILCLRLQGLCLLQVALHEL